MLMRVDISIVSGTEESGIGEAKAKVAVNDATKSRVENDIMFEDGIS